MRTKHILTNLGKLLVCSITFFVGMIIGGILMSSLNWQPPTIPAGMEMNNVLGNILLTSPILALALALLALRYLVAIYHRAAREQDKVNNRE